MIFDEHGVVHSIFCIDPWVGVGDSPDSVPPDGFVPVGLAEILEVHLSGEPGEPHGPERLEWALETEVMAGGEQVFDHHPFPPHWEEDAFQDLACNLPSAFREDAVLKEVREQRQKKHVTKNNLPLEGEPLDDGSDLVCPSLKLLGGFDIEHRGVHRAKGIPK